MVPEPGAYNIFTAVDKSLHRHKRRVLGRGFSDQCIRSFEPTIFEHIDIFILVYDIMGEFGFGQSFQLQREETNRFLIDAVTATSRKAGVYVQYPALAKLRLKKLFYRKGLQMREKCLNLMGSLVRPRMAAEKAPARIFSPSLSMPKTRRRERASPRANSGPLRPDRSCLTSIFFYLPTYPLVHAKLAHEIRSTFSDLSQIRSGPLMNSCRYLRACIDEALRMSPPISGTLWREASANKARSSSIMLDGHIVPPGVDVGVSPYGPCTATTLREPTTPDVQDAESSDLARAPHTFGPFSLGPRACAGRNMAYAELADTVARTLVDA
ncbi:MAG: hypothetical protein LQ340_005167 [Diploschistes diacapsis]|nr:MAG: hypothetical protein LQ340_005167 [Diploschistes diacapsis]